MTRFRARRAAAPAAALFALLLTACGASTGEPSTGAGADVAQPAPETTSPLTGSFDTITGGQIELSSLEGQDVVLWFWAPW